VAAERLVKMKSPAVVPEEMGCWRNSPQDWSGVVVVVVFILLSGVPAFGY